ncbi:hypothetical protein Syun_014633 [Stephania yunnanensis]|uniref:Uncharacterized protein n=1 Tax=Stephania yunnanensis TaxID=152371 RepID=A0AAP0JLF4_9MAGN
MTTHIPTISTTGRHHPITPHRRINHSGSSSRHGIPSPTISAPPSTTSPAPSSGSHEAMGSPLERLKAQWSSFAASSAALPPAPSATLQKGR